MKKKNNATLFAILGLLMITGCSHGKNELSLKKKTFTHEVNEKLNKKPSYYFNGDTDDLKINWKKYNNGKVGTYAIVAINGEKKYKFTINVVDTTAPKVSVSKKDFVFKIGDATIDSIKEEVLSKITVKDNYDKDIVLSKLFEGFIIPTEETMVKLPLVVADEAGNKSKKIILKLQFTSNGKKKDNLKETQAKAPVVSNNIGSNTSGSKPNTGGNGNNAGTGSGGSTGSDSSSNGNSSSGNNGGGSSGTPGGDTGSGDGGNTPLPPVIDPEPGKVLTTCANLQPAPHPLGNTGMCFATKAEAEAWCAEQDTNETALWHGYYFVLGNVSNYPTPLPGEPWSVWAY